MKKDRPTAEQRFFAKVDVTGGCWLWTASLNNMGYGQFWYERRLVLAHRWAYEHFIGAIPPKMDLDHECHNADTRCMDARLCLHRRCVNLNHLAPADRKTNCNNSGQAGWVLREKNLAKTHCPQGHPYDETNTYWRSDGRRRGCRQCRNRL